MKPRSTNRIKSKRMLKIRAKSRVSSQLNIPNISKCSKIDSWRRDAIYTQFQFAHGCIALLPVTSQESYVLSHIKVAREGRDKIFTFSFWCIFGANNFFSSKFSGKGVGAMPYLLTNFWSRDSLYDGFLNI